MGLILFEVISEEEFIEKCKDCMCELEGETFHHDTVFQRCWGDGKDIMNRQFYNNEDEEVNLIYRYDQESNSYEIFYYEE